MKCRNCNGTGRILCSHCLGAGKQVYHPPWLPFRVADHCLACGAAGSFQCGWCCGDGTMSYEDLAEWLAFQYEREIRRRVA